jgi:hypothetical protein
MLPPGESQLQQRIFGSGLDLGREHAGRGAPALSLVPTRLDHLHPLPGEGQLAGASGPYRARTHHNNIVRCSHLYSYETF